MCGLLSTQLNENFLAITCEAENPCQRVGQLQSWVEPHHFAMEGICTRHPPPWDSRTGTFTTSPYFHQDSFSVDWCWLSAIGNIRTPSEMHGHQVNIHLWIGSLGMYSSCDGTSLMTHDDSWWLMMTHDDSWWLMTLCFMLGKQPGQTRLARSEHQSQAPGF